MHRISEDVQHVYDGFLGDFCGDAGAHEAMLPNALPLKDNSLYRFDFENQIGHGYWEVNRLDKDLISCVAKSSYCNDYQVSYRVLQDHFTIRFMISGAIELSRGDDRPYLVPPEKISIFHAHKDDIVNMTYTKGSVLSCVTLYVSTSYIQSLCRLLPEENQNIFQHMLNQDFGLAGRELTLEPYDRNLILQLQNLTSSGELRKHFIKSKVGELLCSLLKSYASPAERIYLAPRVSHTEKFKVVFDLLEKNFITPPNTQEISRKVGLNRTMLRQGFRATYGKSISEYCLEKRMSKACDLLCDKKHNITQIAEELGYGHSTNFTATFKKYFGILPKDYRNQYSL